MTKSRKVGIYVAIALVFILALATIVPLHTVINDNVANAAVATISAASTWENTYVDSQHNNYYKNLNTNQTGSSFYNDLAALITNTHKKNLSYDDLKTTYKTTDVDPDNNGNVIWFYTGDSVPYTGAMDSGSYPTNREHVWPKMGGSAFPETSQAGSDAHHVRPLNTGLNNARSSYHFGETPQINKVSQTGTYANYGTSDPDSWCYLDTVNGVKYFYPAAGYRGATARILFYVQTRWGKSNSKGALSFTLGNGFAVDSSGRVMSNVDILLKWHLEEPPTEEEIRRNNLVEGVQGNRNPFIDHPEFAEMIYCHDGKSYNSALQNVVAQYGGYLDNSNVGGGNGGGTDTPDPTPTLTGITITPGDISLTSGGTRQLYVTAQPSGASNSVTWTSSNPSVATVSPAGLVTAVGTSGTATITAKSTEDPTKTASITVTIITAAENITAFRQSMAALDDATTLEERYNAIRDAIDAYRQMTSAEKSAVADDYAKLYAAVQAYNVEVDGINSALTQATDFASQAVALSVSTAFLALVLVVVKRAVGR